jgi:hypothetical protein
LFYNSFFLFYYYYYYFFTFLKHVKQLIIDFAIMFFSGATVTGARAMPDLSKANKKETDVVRATGEEIFHSKAAPALSTGAASENGGSSHFVRVREL